MNIDEMVKAFRGSASSKKTFPEADPDGNPLTTNADVFPAGRRPFYFTCSSSANTHGHRQDSTMGWEELDEANIIIQEIHPNLNIVSGWVTNGYTLNAGKFQKNTTANIQIEFRMIASSINDVNVKIPEAVLNHIIKNLCPAISTAHLTWSQSPANDPSFPQQKGTPGWSEEIDEISF